MKMTNFARWATNELGGHDYQITGWIFYNYRHLCTCTAHMYMKHTRQTTMHTHTCLLDKQASTSNTPVVSANNATIHSFMC